MNEHDSSRRKFVKKLVYMPPAIASLTVLPAFQASGSGYSNKRSNEQSNGVGVEASRVRHSYSRDRHRDHRDRRDND